MCYILLVTSRRAGAPAPRPDELAQPALFPEGGTRLTEEQREQAAMLGGGLAVNSPSPGMPHGTPEIGVDSRGVPSEPVGPRRPDNRYYWQE